MLVFTSFLKEKQLRRSHLSFIHHVVHVLFLETLREGKFIGRDYRLWLLRAATTSVIEKMIAIRHHVDVVAVLHLLLVLLQVDWVVNWVELALVLEHVDDVLALVARAAIILVVLFRVE